jgi:nitric oxide reductase NorQ protein
MTREVLKTAEPCDEWCAKVKGAGATVGERTVRTIDVNGAKVLTNVVKFGEEEVEVRDIDTLTDDERARVPGPRVYIDNEDLLETIAWAYNNDVPMSLEGHTGTGKTEGIMYFAHLINTPVYKVGLTGMSTTDDLIGKMLVEAGSTKWIDGIVTHVVRHGGILMLDELNASGQEVLFALHPLLDDSHQLTLVENDNQVVDKHEQCRIFATMNPSDCPLYPDTQMLSEALKSRFGIWMQVHYMKATDELKVLKAMNLNLDVDTMKVMLKVAGYARKALVEEKLYFAFSTRTIKKWARLAERFGLMKAAEMAYLNGLDTDNRIILEEILDTQVK